MTSNVNKWRDEAQSLRQSSVLLTFLYIKHVEIGICDKQIISPVLVTALSINLSSYSSRADTSGDNQNAAR